jgi:hypothetical protein
MLKNSKKLTELLHSGIGKTGELASLSLIWLGLQTMVIVAEVVSAKSPD